MSQLTAHVRIYFKWHDVLFIDKSQVKDKINKVTLCKIIFLQIVIFIHYNFVSVFNIGTHIGKLLSIEGISQNVVPTSALNWLVRVVSVF